MEKEKSEKSIQVMTAEEEKIKVKIRLKRHLKKAVDPEKNVKIRAET